jgi:elongation factor G
VVGNVPKEFIPAVEKGFKDSMKNGVCGWIPHDRPQGGAHRW